MVDLTHKGSSSGSEEMNSETSSDRVSTGGSQIKTCADCCTTKTPLWRSGPAGPKSLCNACGIKSRKKRAAILGVNKDDKKPKNSIITTKTIHSQNQDQNQSSSNGINKFCESAKRKLWTIGRDVVLQRPRSRSSSSTTKMVKQRRKWGEEEQAAFLLMALSCGSAYAFRDFTRSF